MPKAFLALTTISFVPLPRPRAARSTWTWLASVFGRALVAAEVLGKEHPKRLASTTYRRPFVCPRRPMAGKLGRGDAAADERRLPRSRGSGRPGVRPPGGAFGTRDGGSRWTWVRCGRARQSKFADRISADLSRARLLSAWVFRSTGGSGWATGSCITPIGEPTGPTPSALISTWSRCSIASDDQPRPRRHGSPR